jgi:methylmalonyl-CoA mutase, C-terminal domain
LTSSAQCRVLVGKAGLDGHDRGVKVVARALRDAGFEVIYTGLQQTPDQIVTAAVQEDVAGIGVSILSGAHMVLMPEIARQLRARGADDIVLFVGGIIPDADIDLLKGQGVAEVFTPGTPLSRIVDWANETLRPERQASGL